MEFTDHLGKPDLSQLSVITWEVVEFRREPFRLVLDSHEDTFPLTLCSLPYDSPCLGLLLELKFPSLY